MPRDAIFPSAQRLWGQNTATLSFEDRSNRLRDFLASSVSTRTAAGYATAVRMFDDVRGVPLQVAVPTVTDIGEFIIAMSETTSVKHDTIARYVSAIKSSAAITHGFAFSEQENAIISRFLTAAGNRIDTHRVEPPQQAVPFPAEAAKAMASMRLSPGSEPDITRSSCLLAFTMVLRFDQVERLQVQDIAVSRCPTDGLIAAATFYLTKTSRREVRETSCNNIGCNANFRFCPAHYLLWLTTTKTPVQKCFPGVRRTTFADRLRRFLRTNFPLRCVAWDVDNLTAHSLRHGGATALKAAGVSPDEIKAAGNWVSDTWETYGKQAIRRSCRGHARILLQ